MKDGEETYGLLRFRIDGVLHKVHRFPLRVHEALLMRMRQMVTGDAGSEGYVEACPHPAMHEHLGDIRISILPTFLGEELTIRLLGFNEIRHASLAELGFAASDLVCVRRWLQAPSGLILIAGPVGCGKTTLLYKCTQEIAAAQRKVGTIEDPVEQQLPGVTQVEINSKTRSAAAIFRAFMRHDVDAVMVGILKDLESMDVSIHAAETCHLTLAPIHVVSAIDPPRRMIDVFPLDQQPSIRVMLAKALLGIIGMRLVRVLCPHCRKPDDLSPAQRERVNELARQGGYAVPEDAVFSRAEGCTACGHTGYHRRTGIYEVLEVDAAFRNAVLQDAPREELLRVAIAGGMRTIAAEGIRKAAEGITSLDEIIVFDDDLRQNR